MVDPTVILEAVKFIAKFIGCLLEAPKELVAIGTHASLIADLMQQIMVHNPNPLQRLSSEQLKVTFWEPLEKVHKECQKQSDQQKTAFRAWNLVTIALRDAIGIKVIKECQLKVMQMEIGLQTAASSWGMTFLEKMKGRLDSIDAKAGATNVDFVAILTLKDPAVYRAVLERAAATEDSKLPANWDTDPNQMLTVAMQLTADAQRMFAERKAASDTLAKQFEVAKVQTTKTSKQFADALAAAAPISATNMGNTINAIAAAVKPHTFIVGHQFAKVTTQHGDGNNLKWKLFVGNDARHGAARPNGIKKVVVVLHRSYLRATLTFDADNKDEKQTWTTDDFYGYDGFWVRLVVTTDTNQVFGITYPLVLSDAVLNEQKKLHRTYELLPSSLHHVNVADLGKELGITPDGLEVNTNSTFVLHNSHINNCDVNRTVAAAEEKANGKVFDVLNKYSGT